MSRLDDATRLLALACISLADDEGYFYADPKLVRAECFPFTEDSVSIHGTLKHLENVGWITLHEHPQMGSIGCIPNFAKHQKVNRPSKSKIRPYVDSLNDHGAINDRSLPEQGSGNREQGSGNREQGSGSARAPGPEDLFDDRQSPDAIVVPPVWEKPLQRLGAKGCRPHHDGHIIWERLVVEHGLEAVERAVRLVAPDDRWPTTVEERMRTTDCSNDYDDCPI